MPSDDTIDLTVDPRDLLPQVVINEWLPNENKSLLFLFQEFNCYPPHPTHYVLPSDFLTVLHQNSIQEFEYRQLLSIPPPALPTFSRAFQDAIKKSKSPILSVTLQPQFSKPVILPVWIFDYWREMGRVLDIWKQWKVALTWVKGYSTLPQASELSQRLLLGLSSFSWSHGAAYTKDITPLLLDSSMDSFLNSFYIDHVMGQIRVQYEAQYGIIQANRHIFATVDNLSSIIEFYGSVHKKKEGYLWTALMVIENKIVTGEADSFGGVMHLPLHWVSIVIDFQQQKILYGDSLGNKIPKRTLQACERWMSQLFKRSSTITLEGKIIHGQLPTGTQLDGASCGLFALNFIAHHYLQSPLLPSDQITLACHRMEIALGIINSMTVCIYYLTKDDMAHNIL